MYSRYYVSVSQQNIVHTPAKRRFGWGLVFVALIKLCKHIIYNVMLYVNNAYDEMLYKLD